MADRLVGEREERLRLSPLEPRDAAEDAIGLYQEALDDGRSPNEARQLALREVDDAILATEELSHAALASSPSPPDRELSSEGDERFRVFALMMYDHGCAAPETCTQDVPCGPCAAADALGEPRWVQK